MHRILITGTNGLVGHKLASSFKQHQVFTLSGSSEVDLRNENSVDNYISKIKPDLVIHCAALANVEICEIDKQLANDTNIKGTANLLKAISETCRKFIYISTDLVFENQVAPALGFRESDLTSTFSHYAHTKLVGESLAFASNILEVSVLRLSLVLDLHPTKGYLTETIKKLNSGQNLSLYCDELRTPLLLDDFVKALNVFIELNSSRNILHVGGLEQVSRYELGVKIAKVWNFDNSQITKAFADSHPGLVARAKDVSLNSSKFWKLIGIEPSSLVEGLEKLKY
jgi:dTDP-4-dehydrorhamnose reductase